KRSKALSGRRRFTADELLGLATATGVTVRWLLGDESQVSAPPPNTTASASDDAEEATPKRNIVQTAWTLFGRHGFDAVRIADIAAASGVSAPSIHYHFANKAELFEAVPAERSEEHTSELQSRFDIVCRLLLEKKKKRLT